MGRRWYRIACAALFGVVAGLTIADGDLAAFFVATACALLLLAAGRRLGGTDLLLLVALATGLHMAVALAVQAFAPGFGGGFITGDDALYFRLSEQTARSIQGLPVDATYSSGQLIGGYAYHFGTFVYLEAQIFRFFGPDVRIPLLLNASLGVASAILIYAAGTRVFDRRAALLAAGIVAFYPSLIAWSSLNLRDPLIVALTTLVVWSLISFATRPRVITLVVPFVAAAELVNLRGYVAAAIAAVAAVSILIAPGLRMSHRLMAGAAVVAVAVIIALQSASGVGINAADQLLEGFEHARAAETLGANTAFVRPVASDSPVLVRTATYLPTGIGYAVFAPVPLIASRTQERIAAPEMLVWYLLCAFAAVTVWRERRSWRVLTPPTLAIVALLLLLALVEGNVGGLFRHRGMVVPFMALLAAPAALRLYDLRIRRSDRSLTSASTVAPR